MTKKQDSEIVYKQVLINTKLQIGKWSKKTAEETKVNTGL